MLALLRLSCYMHAVLRLSVRMSGQQQDWAANCCTYAFHDVGREAGVLLSLADSGYQLSLCLQSYWADSQPTVPAGHVLALLCRGVPAIYCRLLGRIADFNAVPPCS